MVMARSTSADLGCTDVSDTTEAPNPGQCNDGKDNDGDGQIDYPERYGLRQRERSRRVSGAGLRRR